MASGFTCRACIRALRHRTTSVTQNAPLTQHHASRPPHHHLRTLSSSCRLQQSLPERSTPSKPEPASPYTNLDPHELRSPTMRLAQSLRSTAGSATETYVAYGITEKLFKECARQADYSIPQALEKGGVAPKNEAGEDLGVGEGWWYKDLGLTPTFSTWAQVTFLYMYLLTVRFRRFPASHVQAWHQHLLDHFFFDAENRMVKFHGLSAGSVRQRYLKDLFIQWRGVIAAYDEGLVKGDAVLATAVWRNVFKAKEDVDVRRLAQVVAYLRREISGLDRMGDEEVAAGDVRFKDVWRLEGVVEEESEMMKQDL